MRRKWGIARTDDKNDALCWGIRYDIVSHTMHNAGGKITVENCACEYIVKDETYDQ